MLRLPASTGALALLFTLAGCGDDQITRPRADAGLGPEDGSTGDPIALTPGMTFTYQAILTLRESASVEKNSRYTMTVRIGTVDDRGPSGPSILTFTVTDWTHDVDDWSDVEDFDSWVGRLGPSREADQVSGDAVTETLSEPPTIPPTPDPTRPKSLPVPGTFFLDMRAIDAIRAAFSAAHSGQNPQAVDPAMNGGLSRLSYDGPDSSVFYYPPRSKLRRIELNYDPRGFLERLDETIGDTTNPPAATCRITRMSGP